jgi:autotransporter-associated beta strand protein
MKSKTLSELAAFLFLSCRLAHATIDADVAFSYSLDAATRSGGEQNMQVNLANVIAGANVILDNSQTGVHWRIAGYYQSTANPSGLDIGTVLGYLAGTDTNYTDVRSFGASVGADLVQYICYGTGAAGIAYQPGNYSVIAQQYVWYIVNAHELGHNYGCAHADGRGFTGTNGSPYRTVMLHNYCGGTSIPYFSNPNLYYQGMPLLGNASDNCSTGSLISSGNNAGRIAGAAVSKAAYRTRTTVAPNLTNVVHHWMFTNAAGVASAGSAIPDLVSGAQAVVRGSNAVFSGSGLRLPGGTTGNRAVDTMAAYIDLPNKLASTQTNLTIEIWATPLSSQFSQPVFSFGRTAQTGNGASGEWTGAVGSAAPGVTSSYDELALSFDIGSSGLGQQRLISAGYGLSTNTTDVAMPTLAGAQQCYTITFQDGAGTNGSAGGRVTWYRNGDMVAWQDVKFHLSDLEDVNNWLGRSQVSTNANANAEYAEVRISNVAFSREQVRANYLLGPNYGAAPALATAGNLYVDLRPGFVGSSIWTNLGTLGNFTAVSSPAVSANAAGSGIPGVYFNGSTAAYQGPVTVSDLDGKSDRTVEVWAYCTSLVGEAATVSWGHRNTAEANMAFIFGTNNSWGAAVHYNDDLGWGANVPTANAWHHLVYTSDGSGLIKVYSDGVLQNSKLLSSTQATSASEPINLGCERDSANGIRSYFFTGFLNSVRVHGGVLTPTQIYNNFLAGPAVLPVAAPDAPGGLTATGGVQQVALSWNGTNSVAAYNVKRATVSGGSYKTVATVKAASSYTDTNLVAGTTYYYVVSAVNQAGEESDSTEVSAVPVAVSSECVENGTVYVLLMAGNAGATSWTNAGALGDFAAVGTPTCTASVAGTGVPAVYLNGASSFQGPASVPALEGNSPRSIEVWAYETSVPAQATLVSWGYRGVTDGNMSFNFGSDTSYGAAGHFNDDMGWGAAAPSANAWHHLVYTYDGNGTARVYLDGRLSNSKALNNQLSTIGGYPINIGCQREWLGSSSVYYTGYINSVRVSGGALTPLQVAANYQAGPVTALPSSITRIWRGDGASNQWVTASGTNWFNGASLDAFYSGNNVVFDDSTTNFNVALSGDQWPASVSVDTASNYFLSGGKISGNASLVKSNTGTLTLANRNDYRGTTSINGGALQFGGTNYLSSGLLLHMTFDKIDGSNVINEGLGGAAMNGIITGAGVSVVAGGHDGKALSIGTSAANGGYVAIANPVVPLNYSGTWTVALWVKTTTTGGAFLYQGDGGWASGNTSFYMNSGTGGGTRAGGVRYAQGWETGTAVVNDGNWHFLAMTCNAGNKTSYVDGAADSWTYNAWTGNGNGGQLWIGGSADTGDGNLGLSGLIDDVYVFSRALSAAEVLALKNYTNVTVGCLPAVTDVTVGNNATLLVSGTVQSIGALFGPAGSSVVLGTNGALGALNVGDSSDSAFEGVISGASCPLIKTGSGTLALSNANTFTGGTRLTAGTVLLGSSGALGNSGYLTFSGGVLKYGAGISADLNARIKNSTGPVRLDDNGQTISLSGVVDNSNTGGLVKLGGGTITLGGVNTYSGSTTVRQGALKVTGSVTNLVSGTMMQVADFTNSAALNIPSGGKVMALSLLLGNSASGGSAGAVYNAGSFINNGAAGASAFAVGNASGGAAPSKNAYGYFLNTASSLGLGETGIGGYNGGDGVFEVASGTVNVTNWITLGRSGGTPSGASQSSLMLIRNGTVKGPNAAQDTFNWSGNTLAQRSVMEVGQGGALGSLGTAHTLNLGSGTNANATGILTVAGGGVVSVASIFAAQTNSTCIVNVNNGTLSPLASTATLLGSNLDGVYIHAGGVTFNTGAYNLTNGVALMAPTGSGIALIPVASVGAGYIGRPIVNITGGGGVGATAVAEWSQPDGTVTNITITSPGSGYTSPPTVTLVGGGFSAAAKLGTPVLAAAVSGGLAKLGAGLLVLTNTDNTLTGQSFVSNGTLRVDGAIPGAVAVRNGAVLAGYGFIGGAVTLDTGATLALGSSIDSMTLGATPSLNGTVVAKIDRNGGVFTNDQFKLPSSPMAYGGTLLLSNVGATLQLGDTFTLFSATAHSGSFTNIVGSPGGGLVYYLRNGVLTVANPVATSATSLACAVSGSSLMLSWPSDHTGWRLLAQTNRLAQGLSLDTNDWTTVSGSQDTNQLTISVDPAKPCGFYRLVWP